MTSLPTQGVGIVYFPGLDPVIEAGKSLIDVVEVEPATFWHRLRDGSFRVEPKLLGRLANLPFRKLVHGVGFPVGNLTPTPEAALHAMRTTAETLDTPWISEHLSFNQAPRGSGVVDTGFLLPPIQTPESVMRASDQIQRYQDAVGKPFAFETGVNYLQRQPGEMRDGEFFAAVAETADCNILLDVHNLWCNEVNGRATIADVVADMPLDRVCEVHVAGGSELDGYWLDAHSADIPEPLFGVTTQLVERLPNLRALTLEVMPEFLWKESNGVARVVGYLQRLNALWQRRGLSHTGAAAIRSYATQKADREACSAADWQRQLATQTQTRRAAGGDSSCRDPGVQIYAELIDKVRAGTFASNLKLTSRFLLLTIGEQALLAILNDYYRSSPPSLFPLDEVSRIGSFLKRRCSGIPHLDELIDTEIASQRTVVDGRPRSVRYSCDPLPFLTALGAGRLPRPGVSGSYEFEVC